MACPSGYAFTTITINTPGGQRSLFVCVAG